MSSALILGLGALACILVAAGAAIGAFCWYLAWLWTPGDD